MENNKFTVEDIIKMLANPTPSLLMAVATKATEIPLDLTSNLPNLRRQLKTLAFILAKKVQP